MSNLTDVKCKIHETFFQNCLVFLSKKVNLGQIQFIHGGFERLWFSSRFIDLSVEVNFQFFSTIEPEVAT